MVFQFEARLRGELMQRVQEAVNTGASIEKMLALVNVGAVEAMPASRPEQASRDLAMLE